VNTLGLAFVYELELAIREAREQRLRKRIDELLNRVEMRERECFLLLQQLEEERSQVRYLERYAQRLQTQREFWKKRAAATHEELLEKIKQKRHERERSRARA
jgi:hypothetical protein